MSEEKKKEAGKLEIQIDDEVAQGDYANMAVVDHSDAEFVLDFIFVQPQVPKGKVRSRVVLAPRNAKRLLMVLQDNVARYEEKFGTIEPGTPQPRKEGEYH
ncbi:MAG: DUF3467 domain-containing protein [Desulfuromonadales bacterium]|nr:DUF3467 domain-containing protein [Desulfuromonadales bacterium]NIR33822.1 DUF3467 domain-containing protein [Desulfuromonadales bacterium]NIS41411.1 DUF3467 domain-containing protein [Desulfuromonadales bacterium]